MATATKAVLLDETGKQIVNALQGINSALTDNESIKSIIDNVGISHNGIYRGKNFGAINSSNIGTFLAEHKVAEGLFTDLYVGDCFTIQDGTYNKEWEIAGFDVYLNKGDTAFTSHHLALIPKNNLFESKMNNTDVTTGGYYNSYMHQTVIPQVNANLTKALGTHLLTRRALLSNAMNKDIAAGCGAGWMGSTTAWAWYDVKAVLMSEVAVYGSIVFSSSFHDVGDDCERLPIFQFKNHVTNSREWFWLKAVASGSAFASAGGGGNAGLVGASSAGGGVRPLICVG